MSAAVLLLKQTYSADGFFVQLKKKRGFGDSVCRVPVADLYVHIFCLLAFNNTFEPQLLLLAIK